MIKIYLMKKFSKILESERSKYFKKGMNHGHKKAGLDFQKQIRAVEKKHKKEIDKDSRGSELADHILIILAYCEEEHIDIVQAVIAKNEYNKTRKD